jgi:hypothetical protein
MQIASQTTTSTITPRQIISGIILFFILGSEFFINYQVKLAQTHQGGV